MVGNLNWVKAKYDSIRGLITTEWKRDVEGITFDVAIPPSTTATVFLPAQSVDHVRESGVMAATSRGVKFLRVENGVVMFAIVSGKYRFKVR
jgi:alpha-L-rhamnosidase